MNPRLIMLLAGFICAAPLAAQTKLDWSVLADAKFRKTFVKEYNSVYFIPKFGKRLKAYDGQDVFLAGYIIPLVPDFSHAVLSKTPYASCFFCGQAGPETIVELKLKEKAAGKRFRMDEYIRFRGVLRLNEDDPREFSYRLTEAEVYRE